MRNAIWTFSYLFRQLSPRLITWAVVHPWSRSTRTSEPTPTAAGCVVAPARPGPQIRSARAALAAPATVRLCGAAFWAIPHGRVAAVVGRVGLLAAVPRENDAGAARASTRKPSLARTWPRSMHARARPAGHGDVVHARPAGVARGCVPIKLPTSKLPLLQVSTISESSTVKLQQLTT